MTWLKVSNLVFLAFSSIGVLQSIIFHAKVIDLAPTTILPSNLYLDIGLCLPMIFAIQNTHRFNKSGNWLIAIAKLCPIWLKLFYCCVWIYGVKEGLSHVGMPLWAENRDYWRLRESSVASIVLYSTACIIFYASVRHDWSRSKD